MSEIVQPSSESPYPYIHLPCNLYIGRFLVRLWLQSRRKAWLQGHQERLIGLNLECFNIFWQLHWNSDTICKSKQLSFLYATMLWSGFAQNWGDLHVQRNEAGRGMAECWQKHCTWSFKFSRPLNIFELWPKFHVFESTRNSKKTHGMAAGQAAAHEVGLVSGAADAWLCPITCNQNLLVDLVAKRSEQILLALSPGSAKVNSSALLFCAQKGSLLSLTL